MTQWKVSFRKINLRVVCLTGRRLWWAEKGEFVVGVHKNQWWNSAWGSGSWGGTQGVRMLSFPRYSQPVSQSRYPSLHFHLQCSAFWLLSGLSSTWLLLLHNESRSNLVSEYNIYHFVHSHGFCGSVILECWAGQFWLRISQEVVDRWWLPDHQKEEAIGGQFIPPLNIFLYLKGKDWARVRPKRPLSQDAKWSRHFFSGLCRFWPCQRIEHLLCPRPWARSSTFIWGSLLPLTWGFFQG